MHIRRYTSKMNCILTFAVWPILLVSACFGLAHTYSCAADGCIRGKIRTYKIVLSPPSLQQLYSLGKSVRSRGTIRSGKSCPIRSKTIEMRGLRWKMYFVFHIHRILYTYELEIRPGIEWKHYFLVKTQFFLRQKCDRKIQFYSKRSFSRVLFCQNDRFSFYCKTHHFQYKLI